MGIFRGRALIGAVLLATVAGCATAVGGPDPTAPQAAPFGAAGTAQSASQSASPSGARPPAAEPAATPASATPSAASPAVPTAAAPIRTCASGDLAVSAGVDGGLVPDGSGETITRVLLRNVTHSLCGLDGWPGLALYGDDTLVVCSAGQPTPNCGSVVSKTEARTFTVTLSHRRPPTEVLLAPKQSTSFALLWVSAFGSVCAGGRFEASPYGGDIRIPGDSHPLTLAPFPQIQPCDGHLEVTTFGSNF
ncbi:DUF4232 domain-containing protein [Streptacidiphilus sp. MAP12-16]|uniref:DUF4232 domain-containing protein n=1 Tax=Streptacidiphilus sp. MAP12-16 TaxID=3156300 RepID=UPI0035137045